jgi:hypothetical protein
MADVPPSDKREREVAPDDERFPWSASVEKRLLHLEQSSKKNPWFVWAGRGAAVVAFFATLLALAVSGYTLHRTWVNSTRIRHFKTAFPASA